jgi:hypothetical protein
VLQHKRWMAALMSVTLAAACTERGGDAPKAASPEPATASGTTPVTIACGPGQQAIVKQVSVDGGQSVSRVECVSAVVVPSREISLLDDQVRVPPKPQPKRMAKRPLPPVEPRRAAAPQVAQAAPPEEPREVPRAEPVYRDTDDDGYEGETSRTADTTTADTRVAKKRSGEKSALIIAGSTAAGAGVGAVVGGKRGAIIGAILAGVGGTVYDRKTRDPKPRVERGPDED